MPIRGEMRPVAVNDVLLDVRNPRLPEGHEELFEEQRDLIVFVAEEYDALRIARSIAEFGYFPTEPPICIRENDRSIVVEGNRRIAALKILLSEELRRHPNLSSRETWEDLATSELIPSEVEALFVEDRQEVAPLIAYRHISGIEAWEPWAQARFVATLVDEQDAEFEQAASLVGETPNTVRRFYRDHAILSQAAQEFGFDTTRAEGQFGVFTRAMQDGGIRQYVGAPTPAAANRGERPLPSDRADEFYNVLGWIFGNEARRKVIDESRDLSSLGRVLSSEEPEAMRLLVEENDLASAFAVAGGIRDRLLRNLRGATNAAGRAAADYPAHAGEEDVERALEELRSTVAAIRMAE